LPASFATLTTPNPCPVTAFAEEQRRKCRALGGGFGNAKRYTKGSQRQKRGHSWPHKGKKWLPDRWRKPSRNHRLGVEVLSIEVERVGFRDVESLRNLYRHEAHCQVIRDSALSRGFADPYLILVEGRLGGYGAIRTKHDPGRLIEFYTLPQVRSQALAMFRQLLAVGKVTQIEAQTNIPLMLAMLYDCAKDITTESILFHDSLHTTGLTYPQGTFRRATPEEAESMFLHHHEPVGDWVVSVKDAIVATGGFYCHYNPPYGDIFMEVWEGARRQGVGSYLVQELKRVCYEAGRQPAARCNPGNVASRRTLEKAGFLPCGRLLVGQVD